MDLVLKGTCPREVHFHVKKFPVSVVPRAEADCGRWLNERWLLKESALEEYYSEPKPFQRRFPIEKDQQVWKNVCAMYFALAFFVIKFGYASLDRCVLHRWKRSLQTP
ncbi:unnamed protein product [Nippostrongylus brasiliensis]|uniref:Lysocardiolipin acyltransferase 1 (inferred by orthology to a human protein) n=1 Tax=Nippostrongylus brasiliensis TaxID=27835 RepID=A0A0N4YZI6_NIPBR|nr:unnamed protein product [Nippostrongylus brasiliensis]